MKRSFVDADGVEWAVRRREGAAMYVPGEVDVAKIRQQPGPLEFESEGERREIGTDDAADLASVTDERLRELLARARRVVPPS